MKLGQKPHLSLVFVGAIRPWLPLSIASLRKSWKCNACVEQHARVSTACMVGRIGVKSE